MNYGFIGLGTMAGAILKGMSAGGRFNEDRLYGFNRSEEKTLALRDSVGLIPCGSASEVVKNSDVVVLAVKPQVMPSVLAEIAGLVSPKQTVVTIAAAKPLAWYEGLLGAGVPVVRVMPNINARVGASVSAVCGGSSASEENIAVAEKIFSAVGSVCRITENQFRPFSAIAGSSGAFIFLYIDALADAGVQAGVPRRMAQEWAIGTVLGSAKLARETGEHPAALANQVCSPGGTTIEGVLTLKRLGFESAVQQALRAIIDKDERLSK